MKIDVTWKTIISAISGIIILIGTIVGYAFAADEKYVDKDELKITQLRLAMDINSLQYNLSRQRITDRIQDYTDKKNYIEDKKVDGTATPADIKRLNRYNGNIQSLQREMDRL